MSADPTSLSPPSIASAAEERRPLWSVMIPTYNCAHLARETIASVVAQAPGPERMEIVVVDDASSDDIVEAVAKYGRRVKLHRQPHTIGVPGNLTEAIRLSRGQLIHILHGDDLVMPGFYDTMADALTDAEAGAAFCRYVYIDGEGREKGLGPLAMSRMGRLPDALRFLASEQRIMTPSICVRREVYERLGGFHPALRCAEDWEMWVRIARDYPIVYVPLVLARYRMQGDSNTGRNVASAHDVHFNGLAIDIIRTHLPPDIADEVAGQAKRIYARAAFDTARACARRGNFRAAAAQIRAGLRLDRSPATWVAGVVTLLRIIAITPEQGTPT